MHPHGFPSLSHWELLFFSGCPAVGTRISLRYGRYFCFPYSLYFLNYFPSDWTLQMWEASRKQEVVRMGGIGLKDYLDLQGVSGGPLVV